MDRDVGGKGVFSLPLVSMVLGIVSAALFLVALALGIWVETIGFVSLFRPLGLPASIAAILTGAAARITAPGASSKDRRRALLGLWLGAIVFGLAVLTMAAVFLFFLPLRFAVPA